MSSLFGISIFNGKNIDRTSLTRMADTLANRGPDGSDIWLVGPVGLGHCMLWTTPESLSERLPLSSDDGQFTITADARIDNREELIFALDLPQREGSIPDSSLILQSYERWGDSCVDHLLGDFAFAIWDANKHQLFCARDHMGVKPFYYYSTDECFAFASEIKALFSLPGIPREVNEKSIAFQLAGIDYDPAITSYLHILRLPAAHTMTVSHSGTKIHRYWSLDPHRKIHFGTDEEYEKAFSEIFIEAVRCRMRSAFPIGSELSGGLDSSAVVCVARHIMQQETNDTRLRPIHIFSAVFDDVPECDERTYINSVLAGGDLEPHFIHPDQIGPLHDIEHRIWQSEVPSLSPTSYTYNILYKTAKKTGVRVVLSGEWGDGVVSYGTGSILDFVRAGKFSQVIKEVTGLSKNFEERKRGIIWRELVVPLLPLMARRSLDRVAIDWIQDDFARKTGLIEYYSCLLEEKLKLKTSREHHFFAFSSAPMELGLEEMDKNASDHSLESRYPFLDRRLVEFCLALPPEQRIRNGYTRWIERAALAENLPPEIYQRVTKSLADPYIRFSLIKFERNHMKDVLSCCKNLVRPYVDLDSIYEAYHNLTSGTTGNLTPLWRTVLLALWLHQEHLTKSKKGT